MTRINLHLYVALVFTVALLGYLAAGQHSNMTYAIELLDR